MKRDKIIQSALLNFPNVTFLIKSTFEGLFTSNAATSAPLMETGVVLLPPLLSGVEQEIVACSFICRIVDFLLI